MSEEIPRYVPDRAFPPYAYVAGAGLPHPRRDPGGHSFRAPERAGSPAAQLEVEPTTVFDRPLILSGGSP